MHRQVSEVAGILGAGYATLSISFVFIATLEGQRRSRLATLAFFCGGWLVCVPMAYVFGIHFGHGLVGLWYGILSGYAVTLFISMIAVCRSDWHALVVDAVNAQYLLDSSLNELNESGQLMGGPAGGGERGPPSPSPPRSPPWSGAGQPYEAVGGRGHMGQVEYEGTQTVVEWGDAAGGDAAPRTPTSPQHVWEQQWGGDSWDEISTSRSSSAHSTSTGGGRRPSWGGDFAYRSTSSNLTMTVHADGRARTQSRGAGFASRRGV